MNPTMPESNSISWWSSRFGRAVRHVPTSDSRVTGAGDFVAGVHAVRSTIISAKSFMERYRTPPGKLTPVIARRAAASASVDVVTISERVSRHRRARCLSDASANTSREKLRTGRVVDPLQSLMPCTSVRRALQLWRNQMSATTSKRTDTTALRPFKVNVPEAQLTDMRTRINATRWPDKETDPDQGVELAFMQTLARYWANEYDWRRCETQLNSHPQFITEIDGLDIHFVHVRSKHEDAMPIIVTHGWPGSPIEQLK